MTPILEKLFAPVDDPGSRLFHLNLLFTVVLVAVWLGGVRPHFLTKRKVWTRILFRKSYWWNASTQVDYSLWLLNSLLKVLIFLPFLDFSYFFSTQCLKLLAVLWGPLSAGLNPSLLQIASFSIFAFVFDDGLRFIHHWLMHKVPWLWKIHQTHHSAQVLTPVTLYRIHPLESALAMLRNSLSLGVSAGIFLYLFDAQFSAVTLAGVNFFGLAFNFLGSNLRHSHLPVGFGIFERVFISPLQHQIHHSTWPQHFEKNFGVSLAIWDQLLGSFLSSAKVRDLKFGLTEKKSDSLIGNLI